MNRSPWIWLIIVQITVMVALQAVNLKVAAPKPNSADAAGYYAWGQSWLEDGDSDPTNQLAGNENYPVMIIHGRPVAMDKYPIGWSAATFPMTFASQLPARLAGHRIVNGVSPGVVRSAWIGVYLWCIAGILAAFDSLRLLTNGRAAALGVVLAWMGTSAFAYSWKSPGMAHGVAMSAISLGYWCAVRGRRAKKPVLWALAWGVFASIAVCVRVFDVLVLLPSFVLLVLDAGERLRAWRPTRRTGIMLAGVLIGAAPLIVFQASIWHGLYGAWYFDGYAQNHEGFGFHPANLARFLLSTQKGMVLWHPIILAALWGLLVSCRRVFADRALQVAAWVCFALIIITILLYASWSSWSLGDSYGARWTADPFWIWAFGLAILFSAARAKLVRLIQLATVLSLIGLAWMSLQICKRVPLDSRLTITLPHVGHVMLP